MLQWQIAAGGPPHFVGPFSGANAALGYLPLQLALRAEGRKLKICPGKGRFYGQRKEKTHFVRRMAVFPDEIVKT